MILVFWLSLFAVVYCYFFYPMGLLLLSRWNTKPVLKGHAELSVSVMIAVHNEEDVIQRKIENILSHEYPIAKKVII